MARLLMAVVMPSHLFFILFLYLLQNTFPFSLTLTVPFIVTYLFAVTIQLFILLYLAFISVFWAWKRRINPDNSAIPFTSALADVLGNCLMAIVFLFLKAIQDPNALYEEDLPPTSFINNVVNSTILFVNESTTIS